MCLFDKMPSIEQCFKMTSVTKTQCNQCGYHSTSAPQPMYYIHLRRDIALPLKYTEAMDKLNETEIIERKCESIVDIAIGDDRSEDIDCNSTEYSKTTTIDVF